MGRTRFVEQDAVPSDAQVVDQTWRYVNRNGGPDRRFNNNRQIPIVLYAELHLTSPRGLNIVVESSNLDKATALKDAIERYKVSEGSTISPVLSLQ
jgi:hypothetical protein